MKLAIKILLLVLPIVLTGQDTIKEKKNFVFGQIFGDFRYSIKDSFKPQAAFNFNQGIIGYYHKISDKVSGKIMYDVTRTTHIFEITDTAGTKLNYSYFEGSKYTAYLKMAEIKWKLNRFFTIRAGQLLSTQYLTFQDKFWGYRYVDVTFQEKFRLGMPADFGAQLDFTVGDKFVNQLSVVNGEGPFRHQDDGGKFLFSNNIQYFPVKNLAIKLYTDYASSPETDDNQEDKYVIAGFAGYKTKKYRIGGEFVFVGNFRFIDGNDHTGFSFFGSYNFSSKLGILARYDHLMIDTQPEKESTDYYIIGLHIEPVPRFTISTNFRYYSFETLPFVYLNFGLKF
ncbi:MAG: hypothetical protein K8R53_04785 [Bacteroidales bacterium]|nr:hypothetical protein [Bacteroidales bacterium]